MAILPRAVCSDVPEVEAAADEILKRGNAMDAVVAGVIAACAILPSTFLGPVTFMCAGAGAGDRAFDGRLRQPGLGAPRPRGFISGADVVPAARVAVPWLVPALFAALTAAGSATPSRVFGPGLALAKGTGRRDVLDAVLSRGGPALGERALGEGLLGAGGRLSGGVLTRKDLDSTMGISEALQQRPEGALSVGMAPWPSLDEETSARTHVVVAIDRNGMGAAACFESLDVGGLTIEELDLVAPMRAFPVLRGEERVRPGTPLTCAVPAAVLTRSGALEGVVGVVSGTLASLETVVTHFGREQIFAGAPRGMVVAAARSGKGAASFRI